jgi:hypothetical protein
MGHSMGDAVMLQAEPGFSPQPSGVIVADSFASLKAFLERQKSTSMLAGAMPDVWNNVHAIQDVHAPVLVVHSDADATTPIEGAEKLYAAANQPKQFAVLHGFKHNGSRRHTSDVWWRPVLGFVRSPGVSNAPLSAIPAEAAEGADPLAAERAREEALRLGAADLSPPPSLTPAPSSAPTEPARLP